MFKVQKEDKTGRVKVLHHNLSLPIGSIPIVHPNVQDPQPEKPSIQRRSHRLRHLGQTDSSSVDSTESSVPECENSDNSTVFVPMRADVQKQPDIQPTKEMSPDNHINEFCYNLTILYQMTLIHLKSQQGLLILF